MELQRNTLQLGASVYSCQITRSQIETTEQDFFFQAEDGIRDAQESRGLGDVYKRQIYIRT